VGSSLPALLHTVLAFRRLSWNRGERSCPKKKAQEAGGGERLHKRWIHGFPAKDKRAVEGGGSLPGDQDTRDVRGSLERPHEGFDADA